MNKINFRGMHMTLADTISCGLGIRDFAINVLPEHWGIGCCLLDQAVKKLISRFRCSPVKTEGKFVKIVIQMRKLHSTLISSQQPTPFPLLLDHASQVFLLLCRFHLCPPYPRDDLALVVPLHA